jgi:hypothetical protein
MHVAISRVLSNIWERLNWLVIVGYEQQPDVTRRGMALMDEIDMRLPTSCTTPDYCKRGCSRQCTTEALWLRPVKVFMESSACTTGGGYR